MDFFSSLAHILVVSMSALEVTTYYVLYAYKAIDFFAGESLLQCRWHAVLSPTMLSEPSNRHQSCTDLRSNAWT